VNYRVMPAFSRLMFYYFLNTKHIFHLPWPRNLFHSNKCEERSIERTIDWSWLKLHDSEDQAVFYGCAVASIFDYEMEMKVSLPLRLLPPAQWSHMAC